MNQAFWDQLALWALTGSVSGLAIVIFSIGKHIIGRQDQMEHAITSLKQEIIKDLGAVRERLARVEGTVFKQNP